MRKPNNWVRYIVYAFSAIILVMLMLFAYLAFTAIDHPPDVTDQSVLKSAVERRVDGSLVSGSNWLRKSNSGLWEMYLTGNAFERGVMHGKLAQHLVHEQEQAFAGQIARMVPSEFYRHFLKYFIAWFNRDLDKYVDDEFKIEIYGVSRSASHEFDYIGTAYQRMLNYHAAHDIGHALQNLALVGCTSFSVWNDSAGSSNMITGRNFDFYVGDRFAKNKIVMFVNPDKGIPFMMVTWGGMTGVVSGMNKEGLSVTLNAAKSELTARSATPVSIVAREILQYAGNIEEAVAIASKRKTFVSETFLVASSIDNRAVSIEKTPDTTAVYNPGKGKIICTNHFESDELHPLPVNREHMESSATLYRYRRMEQLLENVSNPSPVAVAGILRNQFGLNNTFIGYGNEKAVNQLICHHSVIFDNHKKIVWVSNDPWQLGSYSAYHLDSVFSMKKPEPFLEISDSSITIPPDTFIHTSAFNDYLEFRKLKQLHLDGVPVDPELIVTLNPGYYHAYVIAGDICFDKNEFQRAAVYYRQALSKEIASNPEREYIQKQLTKCIR